ncbi:hypothetical protein EYW49_19040 [Siculibacillus lacustris]|uniref:Uncharacterized protein n=1 Tax=Siculibacillus lacustris TaxID=1549641 RepID=A0A4Q9VGJ2_9HYPH|nr:hypothetical protein [Siculibacillus lacustris]TBW33953.1 hypothetical protein EYW49_19040 [Siculibacillus lacustris]
MVGSISKSKSGTAHHAAPQTLINRRAISGAPSAAKATAAIGLSGAAILGDGMSNMAQITATTSTSDPTDLFATGGADLFGNGTSVNIFA